MWSWVTQGRGDGEEKEDRKGGAPAEDSVHRCHLALTQEESETEFFVGGWGWSVCMWFDVKKYVI